MVCGYTSKNLGGQRMVADLFTDLALTVQLEKEKPLLFNRIKTKVLIDT